MLLHAKRKEKIVKKKRKQTLQRLQGKAAEKHRNTWKGGAKLK